MEGAVNGVDDPQVAAPFERAERVRPDALVERKSAPRHETEIASLGRPNGAEHVGVGATRPGPVACESRSGSDQERSRTHAGTRAHRGMIASREHPFGGT